MNIKPSSQLLALPAPAWHFDDASFNDGEYRSPLIFDLMREADSKTLFELLEEHRRFREMLSKQKTEWDGLTYKTVPSHSSYCRNLPDRAANRMYLAAESVERYIEGELLRRYRESLETVQMFGTAAMAYPQGTRRAA